MQTKEVSRQDDRADCLHAPDLYAHDQLAECVETFDALGDAEIARYRTAGYLLVRRAFTREEVSAAQTGLLDLIAGRHPGFEGIQFEEKAAERLAALSSTERQDAVRKLASFVEVEPRLDALAHHPALLNIVRRLLGEEPVLFQDMALLKPPRIGREKPWHQDQAYFDFPSDARVVGVWIALDEVTLENGCMHLMEGGHLAGPRVHFQVRDWQICDSDMQGVRAVAAPMPPGGCLIFDGLLPHGTPHNHSPQRRRAVQFHYRPVSVQPVPKEERLRVFGADGKDVSC